MESNPTVTIITPVFNGAMYIEETIYSVLNAKTNVRFEYIVIDDGSNDDTHKIVQNFAQKIIFIRQANIGEANTVNKGLNIAKGEYILVLSADDPLVSGDLLDQATHILNQGTNIAAVYPDWNVIDKTGKIISTKILPEYSDEIMIGKCKTLPGPGTIFRKDLALSIGGRNGDWRFVSDFDFWLRLSRRGEIIRIPKVLAQWRYHDTSTSIAHRGMEMAQERIAVIDSFISDNSIGSKLSRNAQGNALYMAARLSFFDPRVKGRSLLFKAIKKNRRIPSESRSIVIIFLLLLPLSRAVVKFIPREVIRLLGTKS